MLNENDIEYSFILKCDLCGKNLGRYIMLKSGYVHEPILPKGWNRLNGKLYCDKHEIIVK